MALDKSSGGGTVADTLFASILAARPRRRHTHAMLRTYEKRHQPNPKPASRLVPASRIALGLVVLLHASCGGADEQAPVREPQDVILISIDTLRPDHTSLFGYHRDTTPYLCRLADESLVLCITGQGLKTTDPLVPVLPNPPVISPKLSEFDALTKES